MDAVEPMHALYPLHDHNDRHGSEFMAPSRDSVLSSPHKTGTARTDCHTCVGDDHHVTAWINHKLLRYIFATLCVLYECRVMVISQLELTFPSCLLRSVSFFFVRRLKMLWPEADAWLFPAVVETGTLAAADAFLLCSTTCLQAAAQLRAYFAGTGGQVVPSDDQPCPQQKALQSHKNWGNTPCSFN